ncbi:hypothetical protein BGZ60DRAFT_553839 [Tricladium varicosporioides]|nr:hypothetical protein BGZ60DRAFT_553839 [Hymenoscyphus varicosporioides]
MAAVDWGSARQILVAVTGDLKPSPTSSTESLLAARKDVAIAISVGQEWWSFGIKLPFEEPSRIGLPPSQWPQYDSARPTTVPNISQRAFRRAIGLPFTPEFRNSLNNPVGIKPTITHGPFLDSFDRSVYIDVFKPITVQEWGGQEVQFYVGAPTTQATPFQVNLGTGVVWVRAKLFTNGNPASSQAPPNSFFGLRIISGIIISPPVGTAPRTLSLKLDGRPITSPIFSMVPTTDVTFQFARSSATGSLSSIGTGQVVILGSTFNIQRSTLKASFDQSLGRLNFAMAADSASLKPQQSISNTLNIEGSSDVIAVHWSVMTKTSTQKNFYDVSSPGGFFMSLKPGIKVQLKGEDMKIALGDCSLVIEPESVFITGGTAHAPMQTRSVNVGEVSLEPKQNQGTSFTYRPVQQTPFFYELKIDGSESWTINADLNLTLDQPRTVNNERVPFTSQTSPDNMWNTLTWSHDPVSKKINFTMQAMNDRNGIMVSYALKNLLVKADSPSVIEIAGTYENGSVVSGGARTVSFLRYTLPFLPDPYASNFELKIDPAVEKQGLGYFTTSVRWTTNTTMSLDLQLLTESFTAAKTMERMIGNRLDDPVLSGIANNDLLYWDTDFRGKQIASGLIPDLGIGEDYHIPNKPTGIKSFFQPPTLMDLSSNGSQFGIVVATRVPRTAALGTVAEFSSFGQTYTFPYSGPSTQIALPQAKSVRLVPVAPIEAVRNIIGTYNEEISAAVAARFSLPFGMVALAKMEKTPARPSSEVGKIGFILRSEEDPRTKLKPAELQPADQFTFRPPALPRIILLPPGGPRRLTASIDPSFPGTTTLLKMDVRRVGGTGSDLIDPNASKFSTDMVNKVPLRRFDISGYGASIFSDWRRVLGPESSDDEIAITKVLMNVISGRTSREVVKLQTVKAPFAVTVTKTVEIKRLNSGVVIRHESAWDPISNGRYFYKNPDIVTHVGIIRGVTNVKNIKETSGEMDIPGTQAKVINVTFDCIAEIEDGGGIRRAPVRGLRGCVFTVSTALTPPAGAVLDGAQTYAKVIDYLDLGGQVDFMVQIGKSGQKKRITSLAVKSGIDPATGKTVAVTAAWGSPIFEGGGQWSFAKMSSKQPSPVDISKGVPLVREGRHDAPNIDSRITSYLFRNPQDLLATNPAEVYSIVHGGGSHRVMFLNPEILFAQDVKKAIVSKEVWVADSLALGKSIGIFPNLDDCLPVLTGLPSDVPVPQLLEIVSGGYTFEPKKLLDGATQLELPDIERTLKNDASVRTVVKTLGVLSNVGADAKSTLNLAINTAKGISKMDITNINLVTSTIAGTSKEASRVIGRLSSDISSVGGLLGKDIDLGDNDPTKKLFASPVHKFGEALEQVQKVISFLESLKFLPNFKVSMTNEWAMVMSTSMNREDLLEKIPEPSRIPVAKVIESFDFSLSSRTSLSSFLLKLHAGATIKIPTGFGPVVALGKGAFDVALGTTGVEIMLELGFGIGVDLSVGPFSASASFTQSQTIIFNETY